MIIPYNTDAPIYHWPIATVAMILVNIYAFMGPAVSALQSEPERDEAEIVEDMLNNQRFEVEDPYQQAIDPYILRYGVIRPWQWVTSNFVHQDFFHLLGNMIGLWGLGLIVEGKVGWWRFLLIFLGIGVTQCAIEQLMTLGMSEGGSLGASSIVYGLMAICLLWAPTNQLECLFWYGRGAWMFEVSVMFYCAIWMGLEVVMAWIGVQTGGITITSSILHLMGILVGGVIGLVMLKMDWVDCEQWDLFTVLAGREGHRPQRKVVQEPAESPEETARRQAMGAENIRRLIAEGNLQLANAARRKMAVEFNGWKLPAAQFLALISGYLKQKSWDDAIPLMIEYIRHYDESTARVRLQLARLLVEHDRRPGQALSVMAKIPDAELNDQLRKLREQIAARARQLQAEGEVELETEDW